MIPSAIQEPCLDNFHYSGSYELVWYIASESELPPITNPTSGSRRQDNQRLVFREPSSTQRLHYYLEAAILAGSLEATTASAAMKSWRALSVAAENKLPAPDAGVGPDGQLLYTWNKDKHHFELEIFPDGSGEFFYLNRLTNEMWGYDYKAGNMVPNEVIYRMKPFL